MQDVAHAGRFQSDVRAREGVGWVGLSTVRDCVRAAQAPTPSGATRKTKLQNTLFTASPLIQ
jgi:hypothetical protein